MCFLRVETRLAYGGASRVTDIFFVLWWAAGNGGNAGLVSLWKLLSRGSFHITHPISSPLVSTCGGLHLVVATVLHTGGRKDASLQGGSFGTPPCMRAGLRLSNVLCCHFTRWACVGCRKQNRCAVRLCFGVRVSLLVFCSNIYRSVPLVNRVVDISKASDSGVHRAGDKSRRTRVWRSVRSLKMTAFDGRQSLSNP